MAFGRVGALGAGFSRLGAGRHIVSGAAVGGAALLTGEANGFAADFTYATDAQRVAKKTAGTIVYSGTSFFTNSGTSSKWVYNAAGVLVNVAAGQLALDYDPVTHAAKGLLCEPQATNLLQHSNDVSVMTVEGGTATLNNQAGPDGLTTADTFTENTAAGTPHAFYGNAGFTANADYTLSRFYKMGTRRYATIGWADGTNGAYAVYDLQSGVVGSSAAIGTGVLNAASIQAGPNGWYRCILSAKVNTAGMYFTYGAASAATITPDGYGRQVFTGTGATLFLGHAQIETGTVATSPIPSVGATVTRAADNYNCTAASIGYSATAGSWWCENYLLEGVSNRYIIGQNTLFSPLFYNSTAYILDNSGILYQLGPNVVGNVNKAVSAFQSGDRAITFNGIAPVITDTGATAGLLAPTTIRFGSMSGGNPEMIGYIRKVRYLPRRPTNAELQTMTT